MGRLADRACGAAAAQGKLAAALMKAEEFNEAEAETDVRKRKFNAATGDDADVTPEEVPPLPCCRRTVYTGCQASEYACEKFKRAFSYASL